VEYRDGVEVERTQRPGKACLYYASNPTIKRLTVGGLELCYPDAELEQLLGGGDVLLDTDGRPVGYAAAEVGSDPVPNGIGIEAVVLRHRRRLHRRRPALHSLGVPPGVPQAVRPVRVLRRVRGRVRGQGNQNPNWGTGPFNDWNHESGRVYQWAREATIPDLSANGWVTVPAAG
jgi:hypothetical protein